MKYIFSIAVLLLIALDKTSSDEKVKLSIYYESLCRDSAAFITKQLSQAYNKIFGIIDVKLYPFGKANVSLLFLDFLNIFKTKFLLKVHKKLYE